MYNAPPPHLMQGIHLVQAGRYAEALPYLRYAVRTETVMAEGWLWLAAATPDHEEYRNCVTQALRLDPDHPVALRMRGDLQHQIAQPTFYQTPSQPWPQPVQPGWNAPPHIPTPDEFATRRDDIDSTHVQRPSRLRRILRAIVLLVIVGSCIGAIALLVTSGVIQETAEDWLTTEDVHTLDFIVGETPAYHFRVEVPESWLPANTDNPSWRDTRDALIAQFPPPPGQDSVWERLDESYSAAVRDPVYGEMLPPITIVETDPDQLTASPMIATLTLSEIVPFPGGASTDAAPDQCAPMRALERAYQSSELTLPPGGETLPDNGTTLAARGDPDDCIFAIHRRYPVPTSFTPPTLPGHMPETVHLVWIAVQVDEARYAVWTVSFAEADLATYEYAVDRILATLQHSN